MISPAAAELFNRLAEMIEAASTTITVCTPLRSYYETGWTEDKITYIDAQSLTRLLRDAAGDQANDIRG